MIRCLIPLGLVLFCTGCIHVRLDPIEVHAIVDINVKVDKALDDFFGDIDKKSTTIKPTVQP